MKFDVERLHEGLTLNGRQSGRTTRMLVSALHEVDFGAREVVIEGLQHDLPRLQSLTVELALAMGFEHVRSYPRMVRVEDCSFMYWAARVRFGMAAGLLLFKDNGVSECVPFRSRMS